MFNASNQQGNANQNHSRYNITPVRIAIIKKSTPVAHTCNPSYSGCRDQEDLIQGHPWGNSSRDPISKI
jgi:hypothetical protein